MFALFFVLWIIFNGKFTLEIAIFGLVMSALMLLFMNKFLNYNLKTELLVFYLTVPFISYMGILLIEILKANWSVIKLIFNSRDEVDPVIVSFDVPLKSRAARIMLANSITLTPGTITVSLEEDGYKVHCLDREFGVGLDQSVFVDRLAQMEEKANRFLGNQGK